MDGGCLSITSDKLLSFQEEYVRAVKSGERIFVVEQKSRPCFNFFVDFDYKTTEALLMSEVEEIVKIICNKVRNHGGRDCLVSASPPKDAGSGKTKYGIHLNFPGLVVDQMSAVNLREHILCALYTMKPSSYNWDQIIDRAVYGCPIKKSKGSGFRLPWSYKKAKCPVCMGKKESCMACEGTGRKIEEPYVPIYYHTYKPLSALLPMKSQEITLEYLKMATVRTDSEIHVSIDSPTRVVKEEGSFTKEQTKNEVNDENARAALEQFIQTTMEGQGAARITRMYRQESGTLVVSTTSQYCENIRRDHGSNHVWFFVAGEWAAQKCFCRCEILSERRFGFCKDFISKRYSVPEPLQEILFPNSKEKKAAFVPVQQYTDSQLLTKSASELGHNHRDESVLRMKSASEKRKSDREGLDALKGEVEQFIKGKWGMKHGNVSVLRVTRTKGQKIVVTTSTKMCPGLAPGQEHDKCVSYEINKKGFMTRLCDCKTKFSREMTDNLFDKLRQKK